MLNGNLGVTITGKETVSDALRKVGVEVSAQQAKMQSLRKAIDDSLDYSGGGEKAIANAAKIATDAMKAEAAMMAKVKLEAKQMADSLKRLAEVEASRSAKAQKVMSGFGAPKNVAPSRFRTADQRGVAAGLIDSAPRPTARGVPTELAQGAPAAARSMTDGFGAAGMQVQQMGQSLTMMGLQGIAAFQSAAGAAIEFSNSIGKVQTIADPLQFSMSSIRDIGLAMGTTYGGELTGQLDALYNAIGSGADKAADATTLMHEANKLAIGGITTVDKAMYGLVGTANAYGIAYTDATKVSDAFFQAVKLGGSDMSVETLASKLAGVTPIASAMGVSLNELLASMARLTAVGMPTAEAVTGMKATIEGIIRPTADAAKEAKRLGVDFSQAALKSKGILGVLQSVQSSAKFNSESFKKLFTSTEALGAALALSANGGAEFKGMLEEMNGAAGASEAAFQRMAKEGKFSMSLLATNMKAAAIIVGELVLPAFSVFASIVNKVVSAFLKAPVPLQQAVVGLAAIGVVLVTVSGVALTAAAGIAALVAAGEALAIGLGIALMVTGGLGIGLAVLGAAATAAYIAYTENFGGIADVVDSVAASVKMAYDGVNAALSGGISGPLLADLTKAENEGVFAFVQNVVGAVNTVKRVGMGIGSGIEAGLLVLKPAFAEVTAAFEAFLDIFETPDAVTGDTFKAVGADAQAMGFSIGTAITTVVGWVTTAVTAITNFATTATTQFARVAPSGERVAAVGLALKAAFDTVATAFGSTGTQAEGMGGTLNAIANIVGRVIGVMAQFAVISATVFSGVAQYAGTMVANIMGIFGGLVSFFSGIGNLLGGILTGNFGRAFSGLKEMVYGVVSVVLNALGLLVNQVGTVVDTMGRAMGKDFGIVKSYNAQKASVLGAFADEKNGTSKETRDRDAYYANTNVGMNPNAAVPGAAAGAGLGPMTTLVPLGGAPTPAGSAAAGGAASTTAALAALAAKPAPPVVVQSTVNSTVMVDNEILGRAVATGTSANAARSFSPTPSPG